MNCETCQQLLFTNAESGPPALAAAHLASCRSCRMVWSRLERIEANIPRLPCPAATRKNELISFFLTPPQVAATPREPVRRLVFLKRIGMAAAAAAILIAVGLWLGNWAARVFSPGDNPKEAIAKKSVPAPPAEAAAKSLAGRILDCDLDLARTSDPVERVEVLARLAQVIRDESQVLADSSAGKELQTLARLHGRVMKEGLVPRARELPMKQRRATLEPIADSLLASAERLEEAAPRAKGSGSRPLEELALATTVTARELKGLIEEATP